MHCSGNIEICTDGALAQDNLSLNLNTSIMKGMQEELQIWPQGSAVTAETGLCADMTAASGGGTGEIQWHPLRELSSKALESSEIDMSKLQTVMKDGLDSLNLNPARSLMQDGTGVNEISIQFTLSMQHTMAMYVERLVIIVSYK